MKQTSTFTTGFLTTLITVSFLVGCSTDAAHPGDDIQAGFDTTANQDSAYIEFDAIVLSDGWTETGSESDHGTSSNDTSVPLDTNHQWDSTAEDIPVENDSFADVSGDHGFLDDSTGGHDTDDVPESNIRVRCEAGDPECPDGFLCDNDSMGGHFCKPEGECSMSGISSITDLLKGLNIFDLKTPIFIKVATTVSMGSQTCSMLKCETDNPCCNQCWAGLVIDGPDVPIQLLGGDDMLIGCKGTECDFDRNCVPMSPGGDYIIWGTAQMFGDGPQLKVEGFCSASDIDA